MTRSNRHTRAARWSAGIVNFRSRQRSRRASSTTSSRRHVAKCVRYAGCVNTVTRRATRLATGALQESSYRPPVKHRANRRHLPARCRHFPSRLARARHLGQRSQNIGLDSPDLPSIRSPLDFLERARWAFLRRSRRLTGETAPRTAPPAQGLSEGSLALSEDRQTPPPTEPAAPASPPCENRVRMYCAALSGGSFTVPGPLRTKKSPSFVASSPFHLRNTGSGLR